ncbi:Uncharacterised protein [Anaerostipes hadrus]|uniref:Uncharacterized protein n=1 Tax=Anaerostipes hadrus TaxID=649756 RepID=A0A174NV88_ANAHA|nr:hypothetical protein [Anaerostipes hadrus]CUP50757.1 Uncharacterised protein [Anaerostipes hadrus]
MELQWNSSKVIESQEVYKELISYKRNQQSGYPMIIASLFYEKKNGNIFRVDLNVAGKGCTIAHQKNPWMTVYKVTSKEDFSFLHQISTTQDCDNQQLLDFESVASIMQEYAEFWSFFTTSVNTDIYAKIFRNIDPYFQIYVNQYQEILVCKKTENIKREIDYSVYDQNFHEVDNGTYEIDPDYEDDTVEGLCSYIEFRTDRCKKLQTTYAETLSFVYALEQVS